MSAFARLAMISLNRPAAKTELLEDEPERQLRILGEAAREAAPPPPPPVISFAREPHVPEGWFSRLRAVLPF